MSRLSPIALFAAALALSGCYSTTMHSGLPKGEVARNADDRWHSGFVLGTQDADGPYDIDELCPNGWSEIKTETSFGNGLVEVLTVGIYNPQTVRVVCAAEPTSTAKLEQKPPSAQ
jgi:hypothetical protein